MLMLKGDTAMLGWWDVFSDLVGASPGAIGTDEASGKQISTAGATYTGDTWTKYWTFDPDEDVESPNKVIAIENALVENHLKAEVPLLSSKSTLAILSQYVLPLLYGLLGSLAYILRTLSTEIQNVTFTRGSEIRYSLRWPLGMLGGVTVGLFFDPAELSGLAMITPLGLAFLAGYGVELLFTGLDRLVRAFTGEDAARPKAT